ncbi:MAG: hypothetical protein R3B13_15020 [Polyangiaceae bacterium]
MWKRTGLFCALLVQFAFACSARGLDDLSSGNGPGASGSGAVDAGSGGAAGSHTGGTGGEAWPCGPTQKQCASECVNVDDPTTGCSDTSCGACIVPNAVAACAPACAVGSCSTGYADCDGSAGNGCEINVNTDPNNCGGCGTACAANQVCSDGKCVTSCSSGHTTCGGSCVDLSNDSQHCGACGVDCLGGACSDGKCAPAVLATGLQNPNSLALTSSRLYWTSGVAPAGQVRSLDLANPSSSKVEALQLEKPGGLNLLNGELFWFESQGLRRMLLGGDVEDSVFAADPTTLVVEDYIYFGTAAGRLFRAPLGGGTKQILYEDLVHGPIQGLSVGATNLYFIQAGTIYRMPKTGGTAAGVAGAQPSTGAGLLVGSDYFFANPTIVYMIGTGNQKTAAAAQSLPWAFAYDGKDLYWVNKNDETKGSVVRLRPPFGQSSPEVIATGQAEPIAIAVDGTAVYWANSGTGEILRLVKGN